MTRFASLGGPIAAFSRFVCIVAVAWATATTVGVRAEASDDSTEPVIPTRGALLEKTRVKIQSVYSLIDDAEPEKALTRIEQLGTIIPDAERLYLQGRAHLLLGQHMKACTKFRAAIKSRGRHGEFYYWLGKAYQAGGAHALAITAFEKAELKGVESSELHEAWAVSLMETEDVLGEIRRESFELPAEAWHVPGGLSRDGALVHCVEPEKNVWVMAPRTSAIYHAQRATELDEKNGLAWLVAGEVWSKAGFHDVAALRFGRAEELLEKADLSRCHEQWAESLFAVADYDGFIEHIKKSAKAASGRHDIDLAEAFDRAATGHAIIGETDKQVTCLKFACELSPSIERNLRLADALMAIQRNEEATAKLRDALAMSPSRKQKRLIRQRLVRVTNVAIPGQR